MPPKAEVYSEHRKEPICFSPNLYRARNLVEWLFNKIKPCRRIATRFDKPAANYLAFVKLAAIRIWLRAYESAPQYATRRRRSLQDADTDSSSEQEQSPGVLPWFSNPGRILTSS
jgi:hypothetical protein